MAKKRKSLTKSEILTRLEKAGGNPWDEVFKIPDIRSSISGPAEEESEQPAGKKTSSFNEIVGLAGLDIYN